MLQAGFYLRISYKVNIMGTEFLFKGLVILLLLSVFVSLFSGLFFLVRDKGQSKRTLKSLTIRISISLLLFLILLVGLATGLIRPHGLTNQGRAVESGNISG